ncbi:MAG: histidine phosphatase family protein [Candidatus Kerfeldbacteria bacterium]
MDINVRNQFFVVRHGRAENNDLDIVSCKYETQEPYGLSKKGKDEILKEAEEYKDFDVIYTSPYRRAKETASLFANTSHCEIVEDERLEEFDTGILDMKPSEAFSEAMKNHSEVDYVFENGESFFNVSERLIDFITEINTKQQDKKILIVTHGVPAEILVDLFKDVPIKKWDKCIVKGQVFPLKK